MPEIQDYDGLASSNSAAPPNGFPDGALGRQYPSITREIMARVRRFHDDVCGRLKATGSNGNYVVATSRGVDLARGFSVRFRVNHENPNAGPTLSVGSSGQRPLTYADGSTVPAGAIKANQLCDAAWDNDNSRWTLSLMPAGAATSGTGTVTGANLSLTGQVVGSTAVYANGGWIATAAGNVNQFLRGGPNPSFATVPGTARMLCTVGANTTITNVSGLTHTASVSRLSTGRYRITPSPAFPDNSYRVFLQAGSSTDGVRISMLDLSEKLSSSFVFRNYIYNADASDVTYTDIAVFY